MNEPLNTILAPTILLAISCTLCALLGIFVLLNNPQRRTHRHFAWLTANLALWAFGVVMIIHCHTEDSASFWLRIAFTIAAFLPASFYQFITVFPYQRFVGSRPWLATLYTGGGLCSLAAILSPWYVKNIEVFPDSPPVVIYGPMFYGFSILVGLSILVSSGNLVRKLRKTAGIQRRQIEHVLFGLGSTGLLASITNVFAPALKIGAMELYGPCFVVLMIAVFAYAMLRYHLLDIWLIVSRTTVYAIVMGFVIATFLGTVSMVHWGFSHAGRTNDFLTTALAALVIVVVLQPLKERVQLLLDRIVMHRRYDSKALIERISRKAARFVQLDQLLEHVAEDIRHTVGVQAIRVLLVGEKDPGTIITEYSTYPEEIQTRNINLDFLMRYIEGHPEPMVLEELLHGRPTKQQMRLAETMAELDAFLLAPMKTTAGIVGMITLGQKAARDIYTHEDMEVFATLAVPLASAIENARLYRKLRAVNLHLERIMSNMRGGVIAVDAQGNITTVNEEAREMLGDVKPGMTLDALDPNVAGLLSHTLAQQRGISDAEAVITSFDGESIPVAMASSCFDTSEHETLGAMVLIYNMTQIKRLESNVQRADRLTSIGTMAAGMAHEIKNPLQSIKTFTQLLPNRFEDADFRRTFSEVVPPEVQRIDTIVTRLLDFARIKPVHFAPQNMRKILDEVLALVENQLRKADIEVTTEFPGTIQDVNADNQRLHQVFLNLVLNALDAMKDRPIRCLTIRMFYDRTHFTHEGQPTFLDVPCMRVAVMDTGCGISKTHMEQLFTPFFTTKADGSGLGLSVVHGIVTEHGGEIDVTSTVDVGTTFTITFPLMQETNVLERAGV